MKSNAEFAFGSLHTQTCAAVSSTLPDYRVAPFSVFLFFKVTHHVRSINHAFIGTHSSELESQMLVLCGANLPNCTPWSDHTYTLPTCRSRVWVLL